MAEPRHPLAVAADRIAPPEHPLVAQYWADPIGFARDCFKWPDGEAPTPYQGRVLTGLAQRRRIAVRGPHGLGKTAPASWSVLWFALTRDADGADWKIVTTASAWRQLTHYLWPEVHKWARRLDWSKVGREPFSARELLQLGLKLTHGEAFAVACDDPATIEGAHADQLLYVFDEAKAIPAATFDAAEGAFSGAGGDTAAEAFALAISTPGGPDGRFYEIHARKAGLDDWAAERVTLAEAIEAGRISAEWARQRRLQWGATSAVYRNRVEGEFAASDEDGVIPLEWVEAATVRWLEAHSDCTSGAHGHVGCGLPALTAVGVDVARSGGDETVLALRHGDCLAELRHSRHEATTQTTGRVKGVLNAHGGVAVVDVIGVGAGVVDQLREDGRSVLAFNASAGVDLRDKSGELGFVNARSAAWWLLRELLAPDSGRHVALPPDDRLVGDLTAPKWRVSSQGGGRIQVESKDDIRKRLGRSTDDGDAVVQAFWLDVAGQEAAGESFADTWVAQGLEAIYLEATRIGPRL